MRKGLSFSTAKYIESKYTDNVHVKKTITTTTPSKQKPIK
jgi:hypothetical protein